MARIRLLILDDHTEVRELLASRLGDQPDFTVAGVTGDPSEAARLACEIKPDIALVDIRKLEDGPGCCEKIARASPRSRLVVFTSYFKEGEEAALRKLGVCACLVKGAGLETTLASLRRLAGLGSPLAAARD